MRSPAPEPWGPSLLRLGYALEFLIALIAIISVWSEIGGQGHLDLMPWYIKLGCIVGLAWCCVRFTAAIVEQKQVWTRRTISWFAGILLFCVAMGAITYYYHLHEEQDDGDDDNSAAARSINEPRNFLIMPVNGLSPQFQFAAWRVPQFPRAIEYPVEVMDEIRAFACDESLQLSRGGDDVGGVLFGTRRDDLIRILTWRPIACDHTQGDGSAVVLQRSHELGRAVGNGPAECRLEGSASAGLVRVALTR